MYLHMLLPSTHFLITKKNIAANNDVCIRVYYVCMYAVTFNGNIN